MAGAGQENANCKNAEPFPADQTENRRSLETLITFGRLKILDLGDLTRDKEMELVCPISKLGAIDVYIVSHHGWYQSNSPAFLNAIAPRVAIIDNGAKEGGTPSAWDIIEKSPRLENLWQLHFSEEGGAAHNGAPEFIANPEGPDAANYLELTAWPDGSFEVFNSRTQHTMTLQHLGEPAAALAVERALEAILASSEVRTPDLGGNANTRNVGEAIALEISKLPSSSLQQLRSVGFSRRFLYSPAVMDLRTDLLFVDALDLCHGFGRERWQIGSTTIFRNLLRALPAGNRTTDRIEH